MSSPPFLTRPATYPKMKWRLGLLVVVAAVVLLPTLLLVVRTISKPQVMQLSLPAKVTSAPAGALADALTILVENGNQLYYYFGAATPTATAGLHVTTPAQPIRQVIKTWQQRNKSTIFIKLGEPANYKMLANILDEMNIAGQRSYEVIPATAADRRLLRANGQQ
jgi:biopolymer transport protein ExbD